MNKNYTNKLVSIIIPIYNAEKYLNKCLDSVCNQTYSNLEIILIDDGSNDRSLFFCKEREKIDHRIRVISKQNEGQGKARNIGLEMMTGEYALFVDSDDYINLDMVRYLLEVAENYGADMVQCLYEEVEETQKIDYTRRIEYQNKKIRVENRNHRGLLCYYTADIIPVNKLIHKSLLVENRFPEGVFYEDKHLMFRLRHQAKKIVYVDEPLYYYVQSSNSTMRNKLDEKRIKSSFIVADDLLTFCEKNQLREDYDSELSGYYRKLLSIYFQTYQNNEFEAFNMKALEEIKKYLPELKKNKYITGIYRILVCLNSINLPASLRIFITINRLRKIKF